MDAEIRLSYAGALGVASAAMDLAVINLDSIITFHKNDIPTHVLEAIEETLSGLRERIGKVDAELVGSPLER